MKLRELREDRCMTQSEMACKLGVSRSTYARYEKDPDLLSIQQALLLCRLLDCKIDSIFPTRVSYTNSNDTEQD